MLSSQKTQTQKALHDAFVEAFKSTLPEKSGPEADIKAQQFASKLDSVITDEIEKMIKAQDISVSNMPVTTLVSATGGPVSGPLSIQSSFFLIN